VDDTGTMDDGAINADGEEEEGDDDDDDCDIDVSFFLGLRMMAW